MERRVRFGPAGLGGVKEAVRNLEHFHNLGLSACEIAFTYGVYIKEKEAAEIKKAAEKFDIKLSIHAPYWLNLNSAEKRKIEESKKRILECCKIGSLLGAYTVVFHPGYYGGFTKEETYEKIKQEIIEIQKGIQKNKLNISIAPETTGKLNVFGSINEICNLVRDTSSFFCIDFAHVLSREKKFDYSEIFEKFLKASETGNLHIHFSGIEYGDKGEIRHIRTKGEELKILLKNLPKNKEIVIINESPFPVEDSVKSLKLYKDKKL